MIGGIVIIGGLVGTWLAIQVTKEGQITERFAQAINHLGSKSIEFRLGGIYALERIARESQTDHWPIMEILTAYVRSKSCELFEKFEQHKLPKPSIQAALTVIRRRYFDYEKEDQTLNLSDACLQNIHMEGAMLSKSDVRGTRFTGANLSRANLSKAKLEWERLILENITLEGTNLTGTNLRKVTLKKTNMREAILRSANLTEANLSGSDLSNAILDNANLSAAFLTRATVTGTSFKDTILSGADLKQAMDLTQSQFNAACGNDYTKFDGTRGLNRPRPCEDTAASN